MKKVIIYLFLLFIVVSCSEDYMDLEPTKVVTEDQLSEKTVQPLVTGMYEWMIKYNSLDRDKTLHTDYGLMGMLFKTELMNDDIVMTQQGYNWMWGDYRFTNRDAALPDALLHWNYFYKLIKSANKIIASLPENTEELSVDEKAIFGQAYAFRGIAYHYLVRLYQHTYKGHEQDPAVPIILETTTLEEMRNNPRASVEDVYSVIKTDLESAYNLLEGWSRPAKNIIDQQVVAGFRARMFLDIEDWANAAKYAQEARQGYPLMSKEDYKAGFNDISNEEWIWGAIVTIESDIAASGIVNFTSHISSTAYGYVAAGSMFKAINAKLYDKIPESDVRHEVFLSEDTEISTAFGARNALKYVNMKFLPLEGFNNDEDNVFMRSAEMYLIEAEALARQDNPNAADILFELVNKRDPEYTKSASAGTDLVNEILYQRQIELWGEGFSFFDHKRNKKPIVRDYEGTNHPTQARTNYPVESNFYRLIIPRGEYENNDGISQTDNNPVQD